MQELFHQDIENFYAEREIETCDAQIEIEKCMLHNGMLDGQEKEIVKFNIKEKMENEFLTPWRHYMDDDELWDSHYPGVY